MKTKLAALAVLAATSLISNAVITLNGVALKNVQGPGPTPTDLAAGMLGLLIIDTGNDGFLGSIPNTGSNVAVTDPALDPATTNLGLTVGSTFGGDLVFARLSTAVSFGDTVLSVNLTNVDASAVLSQKFAIVWFSSLLSTGAETLAPGDAKYGIARGADWTMPDANTGTKSFGTGALNYDQITLGSTPTVPAGQGINFATNGTSLAVVPEPSAALLGALGALALLRRRRI